MGCHFDAQLLLTNMFQSYGGWESKIKRMSKERTGLYPKTDETIRLHGQVGDLGVTGLWTRLSFVLLIGKQNLSTCVDLGAHNSKTMKGVSFAIPSVHGPNWLEKGAAVFKRMFQRPKSLYRSHTGICNIQINQACQIHRPFDHDRLLVWLPSSFSVQHANISNGHLNVGTVCIPRAKKVAEHRTMNIKRCTKAAD